VSGKAGPLQPLFELLLSPKAARRAVPVLGFIGSRSASAGEAAAGRMAGVMSPTAGSG
jgi:hypothetical protein